MGELPFKLKQGQIEVQQAAVVTDFGDSVFIQKGVVQELNTRIKQLGGEKVDKLKEIRDFRKGIIELRWENQKLDMEAEDLVTKIKDFQLLRVTKDLQKLMKGGTEQNQSLEVSQLERKLEQLKS